MRTALLWVVLAISACADAERARLDEARDRWRAAAFVDYSFHYRTTGFAPPISIQIAVVDDLPVSVAPDDGTIDVRVEDTPTIDTLFDSIGSEIDHGDAHVVVTYDSLLGYPARASFESGEEGSGFEVDEVAVSRAVRLDL